MPFTKKAVEARAVTLSPRGWIRVMKRAYAATPLGVGLGSSRFGSPVQSFRVLYAARDLETAIAEGMIRDRFEAAAVREMERSEFAAWSAAEIAVTRPLLLVDLRGKGPFVLGINTDAVGARKHDEGQALAQELHNRFELDGILYASRLTGGDCVVIFDRAIGKLSSSEAVDLERLANLEAALDELEIVLR